MKRITALILALSVVIPLLWSIDSNLVLFMYDAYKTKVSTISAVATDDTRRIFNLDATPLEGKTVWITGSSSGIGAELAIQLASAGVGHIILSARRVEKLEQVAKACRESQMKRASALGEERKMGISIVPFELGDVQMLDKAVEHALQAAPESGIDIIILNAGQYHCGPALETNDNVLPHLVQVNFVSPVQLAQKLILRDRWKERQYGHVVAISSMMGRGPVPLNAPYAASKHALVGYFHSLAAEENSWLRVDVVLPGATNTELWSASWNSKNEDASETTSIRQLQADDRSKMPVQRCAQLIISTIIGPAYLIFNESWITLNPGLLWVYLVTHAPCAFHVMNNMIISPIRLGMWERNGEDALYLPTMLQYVMETFIDNVTGRSKS